MTNPLWNAAIAALTLAQECLGESCADYPRSLVETSQPPADCATLAVVIGAPRARSGSCMGKIQMSANLEVHLIRCCEPSGKLTAQGGYTPPDPEAIERAVACITRDAWAIYECLICSGCDTLGAIPQVEACCNEQTGAPEIRFERPSGLCRSAIVSIPILYTACCPSPAPA